MNEAPVKPKKKYSSRLPRRYGSRQEVWIGEALMTRGLLKKADLLEKNGKIISKKISEASSKKKKLSTSRRPDIRKDVNS